MPLKSGPKKIGTLTNYFLGFKEKKKEIKNKLTLMPIKKIAGEIGIPIRPFRGFMKHFNLESTYKRTKIKEKERRFLKGSFWSKEKVGLIRRNYKNKSNEELCNLLGIPPTRENQKRIGAYISWLKMKRK